MSQVGFFIFTADLIRDTRCLSLPARGAWSDALFGFLHEAGGSVAWPTTAYARYWAISEPEAVAILCELEETGVADVKWQTDGKSMAKNGKTVIATLSNRRMIRENQKHLEINEKRAEAGRKGASKRWQNRNGKNGHLPSLNPSLLISKSHKNDSSAEPDFPDDWKWLQILILQQDNGFPKSRFLDFKWWDAVSYSCGGLSQLFLETEFAKIRRWIMDNPNREPTPRGYRKFVAGWLERAYEHERIVNAKTTQTKR